MYAEKLVLGLSVCSICFELVQDYVLRFFCF